MTRKESEKDSERPHYYSQFWLDVAAGRRIIGTPKPNEEGDLEDEAPLMHHPLRNGSSAMGDGYRETIAHPEVEPDLEAEVYADADFDDADLDETEEEEVPEIPVLAVDEAEIPDMDFAPLEEEVPEEEEEEFFDEEEEEEDDDMGWSAGRGRKKPKPGRQAKLPPKPSTKKPPKRRGF